MSAFSQTRPITCVEPEAASKDGINTRNIQGDGNMQHVTGTTNARRGATPARAWPLAVRRTTTVRA
ncbi:TPA: hypothetical protein SAY52_003639 [Burkholderia cenocepacia]|uniref:hypothetical protein n=1 Tax=unclassified Burkholderia TaxID=2613784 RepID=UPI00158834A0|nr:MULTISPECIES: hypothetical protein [unclassified Burkholderia]HEF5872998.1 hypothetical protein [Burkholderia cenocepacia]